MNVHLNTLQTQIPRILVNRFINDIRYFLIPFYSHLSHLIHFYDNDENVNEAFSKKYTYYYINVKLRKNKDSCTIIKLSNYLRFQTFSHS